MGWLKSDEDGLTEEQQQLKEKCLEDVAYFINEYCFIQPREGGKLVPFRIFDYQRNLLQDLRTHPELIILKARQLGVTELVCAYCVWCALKSGITIIVISQGEDESNEFLRRVRVIWSNLPDWLRVPAKNERRVSTLELVNGSRILPFPATGKSGRSYTAQMLVLDEWAWQERQGDIYTASKPTITGQIIGISTANGVGNFYHRQWTQGREGTGAHPVFLPWSARPDRDETWYANATKGYEDWQKAQEFPTTEDEAFILSGRPRFDQAALSTIAAHCEEPLRVDTSATYHPGGALRVWAEPIPGRRYVAGADTAEGLAKGDYSSCTILDWEDGTEVAEIHGHWAPELFAAHMARECTRYNHALLGVERNNHGHAVILALQKIERYRNLYHHVEYDAANKATHEKPAGWTTSSKSKPIMIDALATSIQEERPYRNRLFVSEARTYAITDKGDTAASGDQHDDRIVSYAIAEQMRKVPVSTGPAVVSGGDRAAIKPFAPRGQALKPMMPHTLRR